LTEDKMKHRKLLATLLVATLCLAQGSAFARPDNGNGRGHGDNGHCDQGRQGCDHEDNRRQPQGHERRHGDGERGAGPAHAYYRGDRLPNTYRTRQYVVDDWRGHGLRSPPRGYHWVQTGSDYVLVAIATGVILELLLNR
jgi:Ni/Co efflux regulator RcnB